MSIECIFSFRIFVFDTFSSFILFFLSHLRRSTYTIIFLRRSLPQSIAAYIRLVVFFKQRSLCNIFYVWELLRRSDGYETDIRVPQRYAINRGQDKLREMDHKTKGGKKRRKTLQRIRVQAYIRVYYTYIRTRNYTSYSFDSLVRSQLFPSSLDCFYAAEYNLAYVSYRTHFHFNKKIH